MHSAFGDNKTIIDSSFCKPHAKLHKRHNALSFHSVNEAVASRFINFTFLDGKYNLVDIMSSQALGYKHIWTMLKPILFFHGTTELYEDNKVLNVFVSILLRIDLGFVFYGFSSSKKNLS